FPAQGRDRRGGAICPGPQSARQRTCSALPEARAPPGSENKKARTITLPSIRSDWWTVIYGYLPLLLSAAFLVVQLTLCVILLSWVFGLLLALCRTSGFIFLRWPAQFYIWFIRGTPALVQIFIVYF